MPPKSAQEETIKVTIELTTTSTEWQDASLMASQLQSSLPKHAYENMNGETAVISENFEVTGVKLEHFS